MDRRTQSIATAMATPLEASVRSFRLSIVEGPGQGMAWESAGDRCAIGSAENNDLVIADTTVSRYHCEVRVDADGARVIDLASRNRTIIDGVQVKEGYLRGGSLLRLGRSVVRFEFGRESNRLPVSERTRFGSMVGSSVAMRSVFALLERAARADVTVLLEGETGTGKGRAADAIHRYGDRKDQPFVVVDCGAISSNLLESELFGHEKGAFTGAEARRIGAFEEADGGTIFLDEIGELAGDLQPKLLRVIEAKEIRRVGSNTFKTVDVRVIAATNRDLRAEVNAARFRSDLYFRLAVVRIELPPLRERPEDIPELVDQILVDQHVPAEHADRLRTPELMATLAHAVWPGNVRELRNYLERCLVMEEALPLHDTREPAGSGTMAQMIDVRVPLADARKKVLEQFERAYLEALLRIHGGKVAKVAEAAGLDRVYMYKLLARYRLR